MAALDYTRAQHNAGFSGRIGHTFVSLFAGLTAWNAARVTRKALSALTDRELEDIGLCRGDIEAF